MKRLRFLWLSLFLVLGALSNLPARGADKIKDAESATHDFEAASYQVKDTLSVPRLSKSSSSSWGCSRTTPICSSVAKKHWWWIRGETTTYVEAAEKEGATITGVWLSHSHADFVAGHMELSTRLKIPIYVEREDGSRLSRQTAQGG